MGLKGPKTLTHLVAKSTVKQSSFWALGRAAVDYHDVTVKIPIVQHKHRYFSW